jgi:MMP 1-O-methyltransferase
MILKTALHENIQKEYADGKGVNENEGMRLAYLASNVPPNGIIVEVGSFRGQSAAYLAAGCGQGVQIYLVDLWSRENIEVVSEENQYAVAGLAHLKALNEHMNNLGVSKKIITLRGQSVEFADKWKNITGRKINLLFIDGDHSYEGVKSDFEAWYPHVKRGGMIAFHDYSERWPGVMKFIDEVASNQLAFFGLHERVWSGKKW